jgi:hypothetical protein
MALLIVKKQNNLVGFLLLELLIYLKLEYVVAYGMIGQHHLKLSMVFFNVEICFVYKKIAGI